MMDTPIKLNQDGDGKSKLPQTLKSSLNTLLTRKTTENNFSFVNVQDTSEEVIRSMHLSRPKDSPERNNVQISEIYHSESQKRIDRINTNSSKKRKMDYINQERINEFEKKYSIHDLDTNNHDINIKAFDHQKTQKDIQNKIIRDSGSFHEIETKNKLNNSDPLKSQRKEEINKNRKSEPLKRLEYRSTEDTHRIELKAAINKQKTTDSQGQESDRPGFMNNHRPSLELQIYKKTFADSHENGKMSPREPFKSFGVAGLASSNLNSNNQTINNDSVQHRSKGRKSKIKQKIKNLQKTKNRKTSSRFAEPQNQVSIDRKEFNPQPGFNLRLINTLKNTLAEDEESNNHISRSKQFRESSYVNREHSEYSDMPQTMKEYTSSRSHGLELQRHSAVNFSQLSRNKLKGLTHRNIMGSSIHGNSNQSSPLISRKNIKNLARSTFKFLERSKNDALKKPSHKQTTSILKEMRKQAKQRTSVREAGCRSSLLKSLKKIGKGIGTRKESSEQGGPKSSKIGRKKSPFIVGSKGRNKIFSKKLDTGSKFNVSGKFLIFRQNII